MRWRLPVGRPPLRWGVTLILGALLAEGSRADSFAVTSIGDQGAGSLRAAIEAANASADAEDTINLIIPDGSTDLPRDTAAFGVRWTTSAREGISAELAYEGLWNSELLDHALRLGFQFVW
jgi:hypothetical protein